jgi:hypothetical protein
MAREAPEITATAILLMWDVGLLSALRTISRRRNLRACDRVEVDGRVMA